MELEKLLEQKLAMRGGGASALHRIHISFPNKESDPCHLDSISCCLIKSGMTPASPLLMVIISTPPSPLPTHPSIPTPTLSTHNPPIILIYSSLEGPALIFTQRQEDACCASCTLRKKRYISGETLKTDGRLLHPIFRAGYGTQRKA